MFTFIFYFYPMSPILKNKIDFKLIVQYLMQNNPKANNSLKLFS